MNTAILIIMISAGDVNIHHVRVIDKYDYLNYSVCMWTRDALIKTWSKREDVTHLDIRCPNWWSEI